MDSSAGLGNSWSFRIELSILRRAFVLFHFRLMQENQCAPLQMIGQEDSALIVIL